MKVGDLLRHKNTGKLALLLNHYISVNQVTGEEYKCAEIMWLHDKKFTTASYTTFEVVT